MVHIKYLYLSISHLDSVLKKTQAKSTLTTQSTVVGKWCTANEYVLNK